MHLQYKDKVPVHFLYLALVGLRYKDKAFVRFLYLVLVDSQYKDKVVAHFLDQMHYSNLMEF